MSQELVSTCVQTLVWQSRTFVSLGRLLPSDWTIALRVRLLTSTVAGRCILLIELSCDHSDGLRFMSALVLALRTCRSAVDSQEM